MTGLHTLSDILAIAGISPATDLDPNHEVIRCLELRDELGLVNVISSYSRLIDLDQLAEVSGRALFAAGHPDVPAVDVLENEKRPLIVDRSLLEAESLVLKDPDQGGHYQLTASQLLHLLSRYDWVSGDFTRPLEEINSLCNDAVLDEDNINTAVTRFTTRRIRQRIEDTLDFPPMPEIANRILQIGGDDKATVHDLSEVVGLDPSLSAQVVSWAASPYYAAPGKVKSIDDAIMRVLGFDLVMNLALGLALGKTLRMPKDGRHGYRQYWRQAVHGATLMEALTKAMPPERRQSAGTGYLAGLLHNFGLLILSELMRPQLNRICAFSEANSHAGHPAVERHLLGATREQMAACLMRFWHLPEEVIVALRYQHDNHYAGPYADLSKLLFITNRLLGDEQIGTAARAPIPEHLYQDLGIAPSALTEISERIRESADDLQSIARTLAA